MPATGHHAQDRLDGLSESIFSPDMRATVLADLAKDIGASSLGLISSDRAGSRFFACAQSTPQKALRSYEAHYARLDPIPGLVSRLRIGSVGALHDTSSARERAGLAFYAEWAIPNGLGNACYTALSRKNGLDWVCAAFPIDMQERDLERGRTHLARLTSHLAWFMKYAALADRERGRLKIALAGFDAIDDPIVVLGPDDRVVEANRAAGSLTMGRDGIEIGADGSCSISLPGTDWVAPRWRVEEHLLSAEGTRLLRLARKEPVQAVDRFARRHGLTPAEKRVAQLVGEGHGLSVTAARLGISLSTARVHLQRIFDKSGIHRQAALAARLRDPDPDG